MGCLGGWVVWVGRLFGWVGYLGGWVVWVGRLFGWVDIIITSHNRIKDQKHK